MQSLGKVRIGFDFAGTNGGAGGAAEGGEKIIRGIAIGDFNGASATRHAGEFVLGLGDLADAVEQDLGADPANGSFAEVSIVGCVALVCMGAELISSREADIA